MNSNWSLSFAILDKMKKGVAIFHDDGILKLNSAFKKFFRINDTIHDFLHLLRDNSSLVLAYPDKEIISTERSPSERILNQEDLKDEIWQVTDRIHGECWYGEFSGHNIDVDNHSRYVLFVNDVSESFLLKAELKSETRFFYDVINALPVMVSIYNPELNEMYLNNAVESITGWTRKDTENQSIMELAYPDPAYREYVMDYMQSLKEGFSEIIMRTRDGRDIVTSWANIKLSNGRQLGIGLDINKQKITEKAVKESEEKFRNLADNISQLAWITDKEGNVIWFNKRWYDFTGFRLKESAGMHYSDFIHPDYRSQVVSYYVECLKKGVIWEDTFPLKNKNDEFRWFLSRALPIYDESGNIKSWFGTNTDITELKNLQDKILKANEKAEKSVIMQKTFIQNISHEVRTPMNSILGFTELLEKSITNPEDKKHLESISYSGKKLLTLINDILDFSRLDSNDLKLSYDIVPLRNIFHQIEYQFEGLSLHFKKNMLKLKIVVNPEDENRYVYGDKYRIQQVMDNLVSNAVKYTEEGYIEVGCEIRDSEKQVLFFVKDTGTGINKQDYDLIFNRFQQSEKKQLQGTGLGLSISKQLVNLFGGDIWVESEKGKGSSFFFTHPLTEAPEMLSQKPKKKKGSFFRPDLTGITILIAEDDEYSFQLLEAMIAPTNARIIHAKNGHQAVEIFTDNKIIDIVFLDIRLPGLDGYEILEKIRSSNKSIPVIAQTAYAMPEDKTRSHNEGFDFHATKPVAMKDLYMILNTFLSEK